jgi:hypothetical protein
VHLATPIPTDQPFSISVHIAGSFVNSSSGRIPYGKYFEKQFKSPPGKGGTPPVALGI